MSLPFTVYHLLSNTDFSLIPKTSKEQKHRKSHISIKVLFSTNDIIYLFFLVCEHPDKNTYLISQSSCRGYLILLWKNPGYKKPEKQLRTNTDVTNQYRFNLKREELYKGRCMMEEGRDSNSL